jgi:acetyl esterase/lipase
MLVRRSAVPIVSAIAAAAMSAGVLAGCGSSSHQGPSTHPASRQVELRSVWGRPAGGGRPRALLLMIHGGGWKGLDTASFNSEAVVATAYQRLGYETLTFDYRGGAQSIEDAEMFYRLARKRVDSKLPICALGPSAGGHIALMLAIKNPGLACVIDFAGPTDLVSLATQPGGSIAYRLAVDAFGASHLAAYSPALHASSIRARVMVVVAQNDPVVPTPQGTEMARALPGTQLIVLPPGPVGFVHSAGGPGTNRGVAIAAYDRSLAAEMSFLAGVPHS